METGGAGPLAEKTRTCPSCRMSISVLATKCRFCGEEVGKPKEEQRSLSIHDLGGETIQHRAPSGSVLEAMEAFRAEGGAAPGDADDDSGLGLDASAAADDASSPFHFDEDPSSAFSRPQSSFTRRQQEPSLQDRLVKIGGAVVALLVVVFAIAKGPSLFNDNAKAVDNVPVNRAPTLLASGAPPYEALQAAVEALTLDPSSQNKKIAEDTFGQVAAQIEDLLGTRDWSSSKLRQASLLASRVAQLYPNEQSRELQTEVEGDNAAYKMFLQKIDPAEGTATFMLNTGERVSVKKGEIVAGRFKITSIIGRSQVRLVDQLRGNRSLLCKIGLSPS